MKNAKFPIVKMIVQNVIQIIIVQNFLMGSILENAFVKKAIMMINKIVFAWNAQNFGIISIKGINLLSHSCFYNNSKN